jgi:hypothetical protein
VNAGCNVHATRVGGQTALHSAATASALKMAMSEGNLNKVVGRTAHQMDISGNDVSASAAMQPESLTRMGGASTFRELLRAGARPNCKDSLGRTALHIMLGNIENETRWGPQELNDAVCILLSFGARVPEDSNVVKQALQARHADIQVAALAEKWSLMPPLSAEELQVS